MAKSFKMLENEFWWGGTVVNACDMPYSKDTDTILDLKMEIRTQTAPLMLSNKGRYIWADNETIITIKNGQVNKY